MPPNWKNRFELKPGRWVFEPTDEARAIGRDIKAAVEATWRPPDFYFHLRRGGHVEAVRAHLASAQFLRVDIQDFFGSVNRSRVTRCLKSRVPGGYAIAREWANASTVHHPDSDPSGRRYILPYGFIQSPILASLALDESRLGKCLRRLSSLPETAVTVYVDDIIVSTLGTTSLASILQELGDSAAASGFSLNESKVIGPAAAVSAFNIAIAQHSLKIEADRMARFIDAYADTESAQRKDGIRNYVRSVSPAQADALDGRP